MRTDCEIWLCCSLHLFEDGINVAALAGQELMGLCSVGRFGVGGLKVSVG